MTAEAQPGWLPPLICLANHQGDWQRYLEALHARFHRDFIASRPVLGEKSCGVKRYPLLNDMEAGFWHLITEGPAEGERQPDLRRCERIAWPRPIIEAVPDESKVRLWRSSRSRGKRRIVMALADFSYLVVLEDAASHYLLVTAYPVEHANRRNKLRREHDRENGDGAASY